MVQLIVGNKGKGKTKHLLEKVNLSKKDISELYKIDWSTKTEEKIKKIQEYSNNKNKTTVY